MLFSSGLRCPNATYLDHDILVCHEQWYAAGLDRGRASKAHARDGREDPSG